MTCKKMNAYERVMEASTRCSWLGLGYVFVEGK